MVSRIHSQHLPVTKVIEGLDQSSTTLTCTDPGIAGRTFYLIYNTNLSLNIRFILFQRQRGQQPGVEIKLAFCTCLTLSLGDLFGSLFGGLGFGCYLSLGCRAF